MRPASYIKSFVLILAMLFGQPAGADITVFAAASLRGALDEIAKLSDTPVTISYGGSGTIARQVAQGAPADVVILAHPHWMDWLENRGALPPNSRQIIAHNSLVLIGKPEDPALTNPNDIPQMLGNQRLAMGQNDAVPAGIYAKQWLQHSGLWTRLRTQLAEVENVRIALALVARGETPLGIVYHSDALAEPRVKTLYSIPKNEHETITYPAANLNENGNLFIKLLQTPDAIHALRSHGFTPPKADK